ncbi:hypothetical protein BDN72DRAFT_905884 [Pluteus cervinus]|uniref:Uncharacterized protein n=1 Tax=Pluteus cervinus TaxID=181527 RepID=A0ACD3A0L4_9AGAR|nr:hypothetical protein BDN72DRAFT_905884 [Pluteus cervinus]
MPPNSVTSNDGTSWTFNGIDIHPPSNGNRMAMGLEFSSLFTTSPPAGTAGSQNQSPGRPKSPLWDVNWNNGSNTTHTNLTQQSNVAVPQPAFGGASSGLEFALPNLAGVATPHVQDFERERRGAAAWIAPPQAPAGLPASNANGPIHPPASNANRDAPEQGSTNPIPPKPAENPLTPAVQPGTLSWAQRNPGFPVQPARKRVPQNRSAEEKAASAQRQQVRQEEKDALQTIRNRFNDFVDKLVHELIEDHSWTEPQARAYLHYQAGGLTQRRAVSIRNAVASEVAEKANAGLPPGKKLGVNQLQPLINKAMEDLTEEEKALKKKSLEEKREFRDVGIRATNNAASADIQASMTLMEPTFLNMCMRTGGRGFVVIVPGHGHDTIMPGLIMSPGMELFFREVLKVAPMDFVRLVECYCISKNNAPRLTVETCESMIKECRDMIRDGLRQLTGESGLEMEYKKYEELIVGKYHVEIEGWPKPHVPFDSPTHISNAATARLLRDALLAKKCQWKRQSPQRRAEWVAALEPKESQRKKRSDAGVPRGPNARSANASSSAKSASSTNTSNKRRKVSQKVPPSLSRAIIDNSDEEYDAN